MKPKYILILSLILWIGLSISCNSEDTSVNKQWYGRQLFIGSTQTDYETYNWANGKASEFSRYDMSN